MLRSKLVWLSSVSLLVSGAPAWAQDLPAEEDDTEIVVTAQRTDQRLQDVPIAVSAFSGEALDKQQIKNASDLQLTLPNVVFSKGNFTGSSFTIRGIGDLCVGVSCDSATAIHLDGTPLLATRLFETEYFDMQRIEVLRGPQGTLFGRNATSGVVNFIPNRPDLSGFSAAGEAEYGNFDSIKAKGMVNLAVGDTIGVRVAGFYLKRDGYTTNLFDNSTIDGRDMYSVRGTLRFEPSENTRITLMASYFREDDDRLRIQKQLCQRDPTGVLGCLPGRRAYETTNGNSSFVGVLTSREFLTINGIPNAFGLGSLYGPDAYANAVNPRDPRVVNTDYNPTYFTDEESYQGRIEHDFDKFKVQLTGFYHKTRVDSSQDYTLSVQNRAGFAGGLNTLAAAAAGGIPGLPASYFAPIAAALIPNGPGGNLCTSLAEETGTGAFGGYKLCSATPQDFDRSNQETRDWSAEMIINSDFDGMFNFLLGGIYVDAHLTQNSYYVNSFGIDYLTGLLGTFNALGRAGLAAIPGAQPPPPGYLATPFFRNTTDDLRVKSYGIFGEGYFEFSDALKLTLGVRYNNDKKELRDRSTLANFLTPFNATDAFNSPYVYGYAVTGAPASSRLVPYDADLATTCTIISTTTSGVLSPANLSTGCELERNKSVSFDEFTGRAVLDWKVTPDNLIYASYSRGYKSGGINPPVQPVFAVPDGFLPEFVNAFEIGSKNTFADGKFILNLTAFYYQYKQLQLSRIVARTSVNDNVDANIWGLEAEAIIRPTRDFQVNLGFSYLNTEVSQDKFLSNTRDPSGGRSDAVIIKDITNGSNCAVIPTVAGNGAATNAFVGAVNAGLGLRAPTAFPSDSGLTATGAFSICSVLQANQGANFSVLAEGVRVNIKGNQLPQAPTVKASAGAQYTHRFGDWNLVPRLDVTMTGSSFGNIFNGNANRIAPYWQMNAQIQLNAPDDRFFVRGFIQNITDEDAITGLYVTDQSSGLFTNIFTLEPRRYGIAAGFKF